MLSEIVYASVKKAEEDRVKDRVPGLSCSGLFPCQYRMYRVHLGTVWEEPTPQQILNMADGWDQEEQTVRRLAKAGVIVRRRGQGQGYLTIGRSQIPGHIDGSVMLTDKEALWEHKALDWPWYTLFRKEGLTFSPGYKCQFHAYMLGMGLDEGFFMVKNKGNNELHDIRVKLDRGFIEPVIEWADQIRLEEVIPEPKECEYCSKCHLNCFNAVVLDMSAGMPVTDKGVTNKYRQGKQFKALGESLIEESKSVLIGNEEKPGLVWGKDLLVIDGLRIKKINTHRFDLSKELLLKEYGPEAFTKVGTETQSSYYKIDDTKETEQI